LKGGIPLATKTLYEKIKGYLGKKYRKSDDELINLYCKTYEFYQRMLDELNKTDLLVPYTNKAGAKNLIKNPLAIEITKTAQTLNNLLKSLGLTAAQRKEAVTGNGKKSKDEFEGF
jgi:P27 family predicted phage terminase small subunit